MCAQPRKPYNILYGQSFLLTLEIELEFIDELENILENNELRKAIVNEGLKRVKSDHQLIHRAINMVNILERS